MYGSSLSLLKTLSTGRQYDANLQHSLQDFVETESRSIEWSEYSVFDISAYGNDYEFLLFEETLSSTAQYKWPLWTTLLSQTCRSLYWTSVPHTEKHDILFWSWNTYLGDNLKSEKTTLPQVGWTSEFSASSTSALRAITNVYKPAAQHTTTNSSNNTINSVLIFQHICMPAAPHPKTSLPSLLDNFFAPAGWRYIYTIFVQSNIFQIG